MGNIENYLKYIEGYIINYRRTIVWLGISIVILMALFPPWVLEGLREGGASFRIAQGYSFILSPPNDGFMVYVDLSRFLMQCLPIVIVIAFVIFLKERPLGSEDIMDYATKPEYFGEQLIKHDGETAKVDDTEKTEARVKEGIGGWLAFFIFSITILSPIFTFSEVSDLWNQGNANAYCVLIVILTMFGIFTGIVLAQERIIGLIMVKIYIGTNILLNIFIMIMINNPVLIGKVGAKTIYLSIWYLYFIKSKRVKNTFRKSDIIINKKQIITSGDNISNRKLTQKLNSNLKKCPQCDLLNPPFSSTCNCGYKFK